jgi:predicted peptidase
MLRKVLLWANMILSLGPAHGAAEKEFHDSQTGLKGRYLWTAPSSPKQSGLLVRFHGSGAAATYGQDYEQLSRLAQKWNLQALVLQTPGMALTWAEDGAGGARFSAYVKALLNQIVFQSHPQIDRQRTVLVGISAGSTFVMGDLLPVLGSELGGGAILLCGGGPPMNARRPEIGSMGQKFKILAFIQQGDFLMAQTQMGLSYWQSLGVSTQLETVPGQGHCQFDLNSRMEQGIKQILSKK